MDKQPATTVFIQGITVQDLAQKIAAIIQQTPPTTATPEKLMTRKEVAKFYGVSLVTLHNWNKSGLLVPYRIGNRIRYKKSEVLKGLINLTK